MNLVFAIGFIAHLSLRNGPPLMAQLLGRLDIVGAALFVRVNKHFIYCSASLSQSKVRALST